MGAYWDSKFPACHTELDLDKFLAQNGQVRKTKCRCPKCGCRDLLLHEMCEATTTVSVYGGVLQENFVNEYGPLLQLTGECSSCGHVWRIRGATQIPDIVTECLLVE